MIKDKRNILLFTFLRSMARWEVLSLSVPAACSHFQFIFYFYFIWCWCFPLPSFVLYVSCITGSLQLIACSESAQISLNGILPSVCRTCLSSTATPAEISMYLYHMWSMRNAATRNVMAPSGSMYGEVVLDVFYIIVCYIILLSFVLYYEYLHFGCQA